MPYNAIAIAMRREVSSAVKASLLDRRCSLPSSVVEAIASYQTHGQKTSSIIGEQTRSQCSPDL